MASQKMHPLKQYHHKNCHSMLELLVASRNSGVLASVLNQADVGEFLDNAPTVPAELRTIRLIASFHRGVTTTILAAYVLTLVSHQCMRH